MMFTQEEVLAKISNIVESGSNANGYWIKFANGIMVCWNTFTHSALGSVNNSNIGTYGWSFYYGQDLLTFPIAFASTPTIVGTSANGIAIVQSPSASSFYFVTYSHVTGAASSNWIAIGQWK
jgi:hypothetical protein